MMLEMAGGFNTTERGLVEVKVRERTSKKSAKKYCKTCKNFREREVCRPTGSKDWTIGVEMGAENNVCSMLKRWQAMER